MNRPSPHASTLLLLCWLLTGMPEAAAQPADPPADAPAPGEAAEADKEGKTDDDLAKQYYMLGEKLYSRSDYEGAIKQFELSYKHSQRAGLLFNIARCHESLGNHQEAVDYFARYLKSDPAEKAAITARMENLQRLIERRKAKQRPKPPTPRRRPKPKPRSKTMSIAGWALVGTGAASLVAGVVFGVMADKKASELEDAAAAHVLYDSVEDSEAAGQRYQTGQIVALAAGGALVVGGAVLLILDRRKARADRRAWLLPTLTAHGGGIGAGLRF